MTRALVVGAAGQDGRLLTEQLKARGAEVVGVVRAAPAPAGVETCAVDLADGGAVAQLVRRVAPDQVYYLAAFHHASEGAELRDDASLWRRSLDTHVVGLVHVLEAIRTHAARARLFYAASSLVFGAPAESPQTERTPMRPRCVYGVTKAAGVGVCRLYREQHGVFASVGLLYNHESPLRGPTFLSSRIVEAAVAMRRGARDPLVLGDLSAQTDWSYAPDVVDAMQRILAAGAADEFIVASGELQTVEKFVAVAFDAVGLDWRPHVREDRTLIARRKPTLVGDSTRLRERTGWRPSVSFDEMVRRLVRARENAE